MAGTGYMQSAQMMSRNPAAAQNPQMRMMKYLPLLFVVFFIRFPAGVLLYYAMSNVCRIVQQDLMYRFDPKVKALVDPGGAGGRGAHPRDRRGPGRPIRPGRSGQGPSQESERTQRRDHRRAQPVP